MSPVPRLAAVRHGLAAVLLAQALAAPALCVAGEAQLLLPLFTALAAGVGAVNDSSETPVPGTHLTVPPPPRRTGDLLPSRLRIPDGYALDVGLAPAPFTGPFDRDRLVALDLLSRRRRGWMASIAFDEESHRKFPGSDEVVRLVGEWRF